MNIAIQPKRRFSKDIVKVRRIDNLIEDAFRLIILVCLLWAGYYFHWYHWTIVTLWTLFNLMTVSIIWSAVVEPKLLYKYRL